MTCGKIPQSFPAFLDMHLIEANLLDDGGRKHKRQEIFEYFQAHKGLAERAEFLKNSYNDIWVEVLTDGVRTGYHAEKDGLLMWEGQLPLPHLGVRFFMVGHHQK